MNLDADAPPSWSRLGAVAPSQLAVIRDQVHHAAQLLASAGQAYATTRADDSHRGFTWDGLSLLGEALERAGGVRVALSPSRMVLQVIRPGGTETSLALAGATLAAAQVWLDRELADEADEPTHLQWPEYALPDAPVGDGAAFDPVDERHREISSWYANGDRVLRWVAGKESTASAVRGWPHHFDLGAVLSLDPPGDAARSIGIGLSPGDSSYRDPYFYVNLWPYPEPSALRTLYRGRWHTKGWTGAVLEADELLSDVDQARTATAFLEEAIAACRRALS